MRRIALVTGAGRGIGRAVADDLAETCDVVGMDLDFPSDTPGFHSAMKVDVRDSTAVNDAVAAVLDAHGRIDVVVCAAGIVRDGVSWKMDDADWAQVLDVNLTGAFRVARAAIPALREGGGGRIVLISSINGIRGRFGQANYAASKAGLTGLARTLAVELARFHVTVNVVAPGFIETEMTRDLPADVRQRRVDQTPLGRSGTVQDVAAIVRFLTSDDASFITGAVIPVDGGQLLGRVA